MTTFLGEDVLEIGSFYGGERLRDRHKIEERNGCRVESR